MDKWVPTLLLLFFPVMLLFCLGAVLGGVIGAARCNWVVVKRDWKRPIITATADEIAGSRPRWPYQRSYRWPPPVSSDGRRLLSRQFCEAYARTAQERERTRRYQAEVMLVLGSAIIGVQIPEAVAAWTEYRNSPPPINGKNWMWVPLAPYEPIVSGIIVLVVGFVLRWSAEKLKLVHGYYLLAAKPSP